MSEIEEIYKFFFNYFKIFKTSIGSNVTKWTQLDVQNAFKWSINCEELSKRLTNKPYFDHFVEQLRIILDHWKLPIKFLEKSALKDLIQNASKHMRKVTKTLKECL